MLACVHCCCVNSYIDITELTIGTAAGITVFFCIILILVLCVFICREVKKDREGKSKCSSPHVDADILMSYIGVPDTSNDVIYEQCGGNYCQDFLFDVETLCF